MRLFKNRAAIGLLVLGSLIPLTFAGNIVAAGPVTLDLGTADTYAVIARLSISTIPPTTINGDLGLHPNGAASVTGGPTVTGTSNTANAAALQAVNDMRAAYDDAAARPGATAVLGGVLDGLTLVPGLYKNSGLPLAINGGTLTLNGDASSVWIFQSTSTLITAPNSRVQLTGGALACNVFWQVSSSATLGTDTVFVGTVLANDDITSNTRVTVAGRLFAGAQPGVGGALTMDSNTITKTHCLTAAEVAAAAAAAAKAADDARVAAAAKAAAEKAAAEAAAAAAAAKKAAAAANVAAAKAAAAKAVLAAKVAVAKAAVAKKAAAKTAAAAKKAQAAGASTSVSGPALPPVNAAGFTG